MSERLPYEEQLRQQWNDLPLPDENMAWADMKRRLEEDDDDKAIAWWRRGCVVWALALILITITAWFLLKPGKWFSGTEKASIESTTGQKKPQDGQAGVPADTKNLTGNDRPGLNRENSDSVDQEFVSRPAENADNTGRSSQRDKVNPAKEEKLPSTTRSGAINSQTASHIAVTPGKTKKLIRRGPASKGNTTIEQVKKNEQLETKPVTGVRPRVDSPGIDQLADRPKTDVRDPKNSSVAEKGLQTSDFRSQDSLPTQSPMQVADSVVKKSNIDSVKLSKSPTPVTVRSNPGQDSSKKKSIYFSAGVSLNQHLPVMGQKLTSYNSLGRKGNLSDYIPSVYFRLNREEKWFIQAELRYGAPQYTRQFTYAQKVFLDTFGTNNSTITTSSSLKKTFYHQASLSYNYYILPGWSLGTGVIWNKFSTAVSEQGVNVRDNITLQDTLTKTIIRDKNDSLFRKSYFQAVIETQYKWKRFSLGARYTVGLQPYIEFQLPGGTRQQERNKAFLVFLRYQLWRSHKK